MFKVKIAAIVTALALMLVMIPSSNILAEEDQHLYFSDGLTLAEYEALHPMSAEDLAKVTYDYITCPVIVDGVYYEAEKITEFNGQLLHFICSKDGVLHAFKDADDLDKYTFEEYADTFVSSSKSNSITKDGLDPNFNYYYENIFYGGNHIEQEIGVDTDIADLSSPEYNFNDCIDSAHTYWWCEFYKDANYQQQLMRVAPDYYWFAIPGVHDNASSIRIYLTEP
jgi:hypothetical protein